MQLNGMNRLSVNLYHPISNALTVVSFLCYTGITNEHAFPLNCHWAGVPTTDGATEQSTLNIYLKLQKIYFNNLQREKKTLLRYFLDTRNFLYTKQNDKTPSS